MWISQLLMIFLLGLSPLVAKSIRFTHQNLKLTLPNNIKVVTKDLTSLNAHTKDKKLKITLTFLPKRVKAKTLANISKILAVTIKEFKPNAKPSVRIINSLSMILFSGVGYYKQKKVEVNSADNSSLQAFTYFATDIDPALKPFHWYRKHVIMGATEHNFPEQYIQSIAQVKSIDDPVAERHNEEMSIYY